MLCPICCVHIRHYFVNFLTIDSDNKRIIIVILIVFLLNLVEVKIAFHACVSMLMFDICVLTR